MTIYCIQPPEVIMKALPWIVASLGVGVALCVLWGKRSRQYQTIGGEDLHDAIEDVAETTFGWGTKQRVAGSAERVTGKLKEGLGRIAGDDDLAADGVLTQAAGIVKDAAGSLAQATGETIHNLNPTGA
jgi:uncharacterized protein YjbJ (UPF0337 family)